MNKLYPNREECDHSNYIHWWKRVNIVYWMIVILVMGMVIGNIIAINGISIYEIDNNIEPDIRFVNVSQQLLLIANNTENIVGNRYINYSIDVFYNLTVDIGGVQNNRIYLLEHFLWNHVSVEVTTALSGVAMIIDEFNAVSFMMLTVGKLSFDYIPNNIVPITHYGHVSIIDNNLYYYEIGIIDTYQHATIIIGYSHQTGILQYISIMTVDDYIRADLLNITMIK